MKRISIKTLSLCAAIAAAALAAGCSKEESGDVIKVAAADGSVPAEDCTVTVEGGVATIATHILDVALKAAFPSTAAVMSGEQITGVKVPATQTGIAEDAITAMSDIAAGATNAVAAATSYTIDGNGWHDYVEVGGKKWATTNIGASSSTDCGEYFAWGAVVGQTTPFSTPFSVENVPYFDFGTYAYYKYTGSDSRPTLELVDDAAYKNWGGAWRMPTTDEFGTLISSTGTTTDDFGGGGLTINGTDLFFPATGNGDGTALRDTDFGFYWSSSLSTNSSNAYHLEFCDFDVLPQDGNLPRFLGFSVRPLQEL